MKLFLDDRILIFILVLAWTGFFYPSFVWFFDTLFFNYSLQNLLLLVLILSALVRTIIKTRHQLDLSFSFRWLPFGIVILTIPLYLVAAGFVRMNIISCTICFISFYGLSGFFLPLRIWKRGLIPLLLLIQTLPYGNQLDVYFGFPLRLHAASSVTDLLGWFNIHGISKETIITIENRSAEVSEACSGLNGLWTGWLFFFAISWIERVKMNGRWCLLFLCLNLLIYSFNLIRIFILVVLEVVLEQREMASIVHVPLGLIGFVFSCFICWFLMSHFLQQRKQPQIVVPTQAADDTVYRKVNLLLLSALLVFASFVFKEPGSVMGKAEELSVSWPSEIQVTDLPLTAGEEISFRKEASMAGKYRFHYKNISGSCLLVFTSGWRGHHPPELCTQANGFAIEKSETRLISADMPVQFLELAETDMKSCYWFQSNEKIIQDHAGRVWESIAGGDKEWVMVSMLFDQDPLEFPLETEFALTRVRHTVQEFLLSKQRKTK